MGRAPALTGIFAVGWLACVGCNGPPHPEVLVEVTTDLATPADVAADPSILGTAAIDHVRAEVLSMDGTTLAQNDFTISSAADFPLSFGVEVAADVPRLIRVTGYRIAPALARDDIPRPPPLASVSRLVRAGAGKDEVRHVSVTLRGDCLGRPDDVAKLSTCARTPDDDATVDDSSDRRKTATWSDVRSVPCTRTAPSGLTCVPGGIADLGSPDLVSVDSGSGLVASPPRLARVAPFLIDTEEVTVALFRSIYASKKLVAAKPASADADPRCNYSDAAGRHENEAVRCVSFDSARAVCRARGGDLPTLAQWEFAARGRGLSYRYPWGNDAPLCCTASLASTGAGFGCPQSLDVGVFAKKKCTTHDVSVDGVRDLGGSVREWVQDAAISTAVCGGTGILGDSACAPPDKAGGSTKGGSYLTPLEGASSALRREPADDTDVGFRCVR